MARLYKIVISVINDGGAVEDKIESEFGWHTIDDAKNWAKALYVTLQRMIATKAIERVVQKKEKKRYFGFRWFGKSKEEV